MNPRIEEIIPQTRDEWIGEIKKTLRRWDGIKKYHPQKWEELNIHKIVIDDIAFLLAEVERLEREKFVLSSMTKETWEIERMRAWTALVAAALTKTESASWSLTLGDNLHEEWEKRFPEPKEDKSKEPLIEQLKKKWFYSGKWHDAECACILHDQGNCNCKPFDIESIL